MTLALEILGGASLGTLGAASHLWWTHRRARWVGERRTRRAIAVLPLALAGPVLAVVVAIQLGRVATWSSVIALVLTYQVVLWRFRAGAT